MRLALVCFYCLCVFVYVLYFIATMSFAGYFLPVLFCMLSMLISDSRFDLVWFRLSCDHGWIRSGSVNVRKQQQQQLLLHFIPLSLSLLCPPIWAVLHHLYMYMVAFLALRILYVVALVCFVFVPCFFFPPSESLPGKDVLCRLLPRPLPSVCFLFFSFLFRPCSPPICFGVTSSIL